MLCKLGSKTHLRLERWAGDQRHNDVGRLHWRSTASLGLTTVGRSLDIFVGNGTTDIEMPATLRHGLVTQLVAGSAGGHTLRAQGENAALCNVAAACKGDEAHRQRSPMSAVACHLGALALECSRLLTALFKLGTAAFGGMVGILIMSMIGLVTMPGQIISSLQRGQAVSSVTGEERADQVDLIEVRREISERFGATETEGQSSKNISSLKKAIDKARSQRLRPEIENRFALAWGSIRTSEARYQKIGLKKTEALLFLPQAVKAARATLNDLMPSSQGRTGGDLLRAYIEHGIQMSQNHIDQEILRIARNAFEEIGSTAEQKCKHFVGEWDHQLLDSPYNKFFEDLKIQSSHISRIQNFLRENSPQIEGSREDWNELYEDCETLKSGLKDTETNTSKKIDNLINIGTLSRNDRA